jgi:hypothetical protein
LLHVDEITSSHRLPEGLRPCHRIDDYSRDLRLAKWVRVEPPGFKFCSLIKDQGRKSLCIRSVIAKLFISWILAHGALGAATPLQDKSLLGGKRAVEFVGVNTPPGSDPESKR